MENCLNILHFCFYRAHYKSHLFANKINPFRLLAEMSFIKKRLEKKGITNIQEEIDKAFGDKNFGLSMTVAGGILLAILFFFFLALVNLYIGLFDLEVNLSMVHFIPCGVLSILLSYFYVFKKDKYIKYFDEFEKWRKPQSRKYGWLSFTFLLLVIVLFIIGIKF